MDGNQFSKFLIESDKSVIKRKDIISFGKKQGKTIDKDLFYFKDLEDFYLKDKIEDPYDLIFLLLHTQLLRKDVRRILDKRKVITIATCYPVLRASFTVGMEEEQAKERFLNLANKCEAILANNRKTLQDLKSMYNGKTFYACRGIDENVFYETKEFKEKPTNDFTVAYVGKPVDEKGLDNIIIPACKEAGIKLITNTRNYTNALDENKMREFYNQADAYIVASSIDGTPNPALEASACGLTLISNHIGNMPELIIDSKNGFLVKEREIKYYVEILN
jgi:glycosyltransferase involved in cell wall biosynthesis